MHSFIEKDILRFEKYSVPEPNTGCWLWTAYADKNGYGYMRVGNTEVGRRTMAAYRFSYIIHKGPIPDGLCIDHLCRVTNCVNPNHLEAVTHKVNILRGENISAKKAKQTHCKNGHPFSSENTYSPPKGGRVCRACMLNYGRAHYKPNPRIYVKRTHCARGHELVDGSYFVEANGGRRCKLCNTIRAREYRAKVAARKLVS